jgi:hypothetical protein
MVTTRLAHLKGLRRRAAFSGLMVLKMLWTLALPVDAGEAEGSEAPAAWSRLASATGQAGLAIAEGIATGDYRGYGLRDILPLEQIYFPEVALPSEQHPSLLFSSADVTLIRERIGRDPYARWWDTVLKKARASLQLNLADSDLAEMERARAVKSCAFAWLITGQGQYLRKAHQGLMNISPPPSVTTPEGGQPGRGWGDWIRASFIMPMYCLAYDLTAQDLPLQDRHVIVGRIAAEADQLYRNLIFAPPNNHKTIMATAVGTAAMTIPAYDREQTQAWLDAAMINLRSGLAQIDRDGSYREGVFYAGYISQLLFPFLFYLKQTTGADLFSHRRVEDLTAWFLRIGLPDGSIPLFDDAWQERHLFLPLLVGQSTLGGVARWRYERLPQLASGRLNEVEFICAFDDRVPAQPPPWERTAFFPEGGMAVLGDGWTSEGMYLLLLGENEQALASGHEHIDPGHLVLHAFGQELLTDPAAGPRGRESKDRNWYLSGEAHNMLLVDGNGPVNNPFSSDQLGGDLMHCFSGPALSGAAVRTHYAGTEIQRDVFFLGRRYFLLFDRLRSAQPHRYELVLHGLGQARLEAPQRIGWISEKASLQVELLGPETEPLELSLRTGQESPRFMNTQTHTYLRAGRSRRKNAQFTTLLLPQRNDRPGLEVVEVPVTAGGRSRAWEIRGKELKEVRHTILTTDGRAATAGGISTDGLVSVTAIDELGERAFFLAAQATFYEHLGDTCFCSDRPVTVSLITLPDRWSGYLDAGQDSVTLVMETGFDPGEVRFDRYPHPYRYRSGKVTVTLEGSGLLELGGGPPLVRIPEESRDPYPFLEQVARQDNPRDRWEELSAEQQLLAQQQAVHLAGEQLAPPLRDLSRRMGLGPKGLEQALGVITGLADRAYDPENWARLNLPEHLHGRADAHWGQLFYRQKGTLMGDGLQVEQLQGGILSPSGASLTAGYYAPYTGVAQGIVEYRGPELSITAARERTSHRQRNQLSIFHHPRNMWWGLQGQIVDGWEAYGLDLIFRGPSLTAELSGQVEPRGRRARRLFLAHSGRRFSPRLEWRDNGGSTGKLQAGWSSLPAAHWSWEMDSRFQENDRGWQVGELISLITATGPILTGEWNSEFCNDIGWTGWAQLDGHQGDTRWKLRCQYRQQHRPFIVQDRLSIWRDWGRWVSLNSSLSHWPGGSGDDDVRGALSVHLGPPRAVRWHLKLEGDARWGKNIDWGIGLDHEGQPSWGGEWTRQRSWEGGRLSSVTFHGAVTNSRGSGLRGKLEVQFCPSYDVEAYRIEIQQVGPACSPGLLFSRQPLVGVRNDGFIRFRF